MTRSALVLALALPLWAAGCNKPAATTSAAAPAAAPTTPTTIDQTVGDDPAVPRLAIGTKAHCAVTNEEFTVADSTVQVTYQGKRYAFCCADCRPTFAKNPGKYAVR
jgi:YHS domain-containing protein